MRLAIIADDLTGAADTGVQFAKQGFHIILFPFSLESTDICLHETAGIAINTSTRGLRAELAYDAVRNTAALLKKLDPQIVYKKIDSTLRGNLGAEIQALLDTLGYKTAIIAPAFPAQNRTTIGGIHLVNLQSLSQTEAASDPVSPVSESHIPTLIRAQTGLKVGHISIEEVRQGSECLKKSVLQRAEDGERLIIFDAVTDQDLGNIAGAAISMPSIPLMVGSAGLAHQMAGLIKPSGRSESQFADYERIREGIVIIISGSLSSVTSGQLEEIRISGKGRIIPLDFLKLAESQAFGSGSENVELWKSSIKFAQAFPKLEVISQIIPSAGKDKVIGIQSVAENGNQNNRARYAALVADYLGRIACRIINNCPRPICGLILVGGDTALSVFNHLGIFRLRLIDEVLPGIPYGQVMDGEYTGLIIITKAGAFGNKKALMKCIEFLVG